MDENISWFCEVTGASATQATQYLSFADNNLEQATILYFAQQPNAASSSSAAAEASNNNNIDNSLLQINGREAARPQTNVTLNEPLPNPFSNHLDLIQHHNLQQSMIMNPHHHNDMMMMEQGDMNDDHEEDPYNRSPNMHRSASLRRVNHPNSGSEFSSQNERLNSMFSLPPSLKRINSTWESSKQMALRQKKLILITIHDPEEFASHCMIRDIWSKDAIIEFVNENFIFCYYTLGNMNAKSHIITYPVFRYPYVAIIDPLTGERMIQWNSVSKEKFMEESLEIISSGQIKVKSKPVSELTETEQLEIALKASLAGKPAKAESPIVIEDDSPEDVFDAIEAIETPEPLTGDITRIQFRCPDGQRIVRKFLKLDVIKSLFSFVKARASDIIGGSKFDLSYLRVSLMNQMDLTLEQADLLNGAVLIEKI